MATPGVNGSWCVYVAFSPEMAVLGTFVSRRSDVRVDLVRLYPSDSLCLAWSDTTSAQKSSCRLLERGNSRGMSDPDAIFTVWGRVA